MHWTAGILYYHNILFWLLQLQWKHFERETPILCFSATFQCRNIHCCSSTLKNKTRWKHDSTARKHLRVQQSINCRHSFLTAYLQVKKSAPWSALIMIPLRKRTHFHFITTSCSKLTLNKTPLIVVSSRSSTCNICRCC